MKYGVCITLCIGMFLNSGIANALSPAKDFLPMQSIGPAGMPSVDMAAADVDDDGDIDILVANDGARNRLYRNRGNGTFAIEYISADSLKTRDIKAVDMDNDGDLDIITAEGAASGNVSSKLYLNDGTGHFGSGINFENHSAPYYGKSIAAGDLNGDGKIDVVIAYYGKNRVCLQDTITSWTCGDLSDANNHTASIAIADIDKDGRPDVVTANTNTYNFVYFNNGSSTSPTREPFGPSFDNSYGLAVGDLNHDGNPDIVVGNYNGINRLYQFKGTRSLHSNSNLGNFTQKTYGISLGDIDRDGDLDVLVANDRQDNLLMKNRGNGYFQETDTFLLQDPGESYQFVIADFNRDGKKDIGCANNFGSNALFFHKHNSLSLLLAPVIAGAHNSSQHSPLRFTTASTLSDATLGHYYTQRLKVEGGSPPYRWLPADNIQLPQGLSINPATGLLSGTPVVTSAHHTLREKVVDANHTEVVKEFYFAIKPVSASGSPAPPSNLRTSPYDSTSIRMDWTDNADNEEYIEIERARDVLHFSYDDQWSGASPIRDTGLTEDTLYCYRIRSHNTAGNSSYSNISCSWTTATTVPHTPYNLAAKSVSDTTILLTWVNSSQSDKYEIFESVDNGAFVDAGTVPQDNVPGAYINGLSAGHTYKYKIQAHNNHGYSSNSLPSNAVTTPGSAAGQIVQIHNNSSYPIISLKIDNIEQFTETPLGIPPGGIHQVDVATGQHSFVMINGFWDGCSRFTMYTYQGSWNQSAPSHTLTMNNPTISQLLTKFSAQKYYLGETWVGTSFHYQGFRFFSNGTYNFYKDNHYVGQGSYSLVSYPGSYTVTFKVTGNQNATGYYDELGGSFYMSNGPPDWPNVKYTDAGD